MKARVATPLSKLLHDASADELQRIAELSEAFEIRDHIEPALQGKPRLYHSEYSLIEPWDDEARSAVSAMMKLEDPVLVSFHVLACFEKPKAGRGGKFLPEGKKMSESEMLENAEYNADWLREGFAPRLYLIENNNFFPTGAYETVTDPIFLSAVVDRADVGLLLDIGHAEISAKHTGVSLDAYISALPLAKVRQIHLNGILRGEVSYEDTHGPLEEEDWSNFQKIARRCPALEYVTIEYYQEPRKLVAMLERLQAEL